MAAIFVGLNVLSTVSLEYKLCVSSPLITPVGTHDLFIE